MTSSHRAKRHRIWGACGLLSATLALAAGARAQDPDEPPPGRPEDILRNITVAVTPAGQGKPLPKIALVPTLATDESDVTLRNVVRRDLDLCGEFEVMPEPDDAGLGDEKVDVAAWKKKGAEALVRLVGTTQNGKAKLVATAWLTDSGDAPVFEKTLEVDADQARVESHRLADAVISALTGTPGGFSSEMTFVYGQGKSRRVYVMDSDGNDPRAVSPPEQLAVGPEFGPDHRLYWAASTDRGAFKLYQAGKSDSLPLTPGGSVYGVAFSRKLDKVAVSIARGSGIFVFAGPDLEHLTQASQNDLAMHPAWSPNDKLAFVGATKWGTRVFVDDKPVSPAGLMASAPVFCRHPEGVRALFTVGIGKATDIVASGETGGGLVRLTEGGTARFPACSPDGRLVAFFSKQKSGEGPGLYLMRIDGTRRKRISTLVGDSLRWARVPAGKITRIPQHTAAAK